MGSRNAKGLILGECNRLNPASCEVETFKIIIRAAVGSFHIPGFALCHLHLIPGAEKGLQQYNQRQHQSMFSKITCYSQC